MKVEKTMFEEVILKQILIFSLEERLKETEGLLKKTGLEIQIKKLREEVMQ